MIKTLRISFAIRSTCTANGVLYSLKQIPLVKKLFPDSLYGIRGLKIFANVIAALWEFVSAFFGKLLYFLLMIFFLSDAYSGVPKDSLLFLTRVHTIKSETDYQPTTLTPPTGQGAALLFRSAGRSFGPCWPEG